MLNITLDLDTGLAKLATATTIKAGAQVPVTINTVRGATPASPGTSPAFELGLGTDATPPVLKAYLDTFTAENTHTFTGVLDANDTRLVDFMAGKGTVNFGCEVAWTVAGQLQVAPSFTVPVQARIIPSDPTSEGGPEYYTGTEVDALLAGRQPLDSDLTAIAALSTASFGRALLALADAAALRTAAGGTTVGGNLLTLTNPGAVRFLRINADNTVTARTAAELLTDLGGRTWLIKTTTYTAASFERIQADTSAAAWTLTLPASPSVGDEVIVEDAALTWDTNNLTLARNGLKINGGTADYTADVIGGKLSCTYLSAGYGWSIK